MKLLIPLFCLFCFLGSNLSAQDTLVTYKEGNIVCKVVKITDTDIEYRKKNDPEAPIYVISKDKVREIRFADGTRELVMQDEMSMDKEKAILDKRSAIKFHFFSPIMDQLTLSFERCVKVGMNLEASIGIINNSMFPFSISNFEGGEYSKLTQGMTASFGLKFLPGKDFHLKGLKYAHPLKGFFFKPELMYSVFSVRGLSYTYYPNPWPSPPVTVSTDLNVNSFALMLTAGHQFILGNTLTFGCAVGVGYSMVQAKYTNPDYHPLWWNEDPERYTTYYYNHLRSGGSPLTLSGNITLGYILK